MYSSGRNAVGIEEEGGGGGVLFCRAQGGRGGKFDHSIQGGGHLGGEGGVLRKIIVIVFTGGMFVFFHPLFWGVGWGPGCEFHEFSGVLGGELGNLFFAIDFYLFIYYCLVMCNRPMHTY